MEFSTSRFDTQTSKWLQPVEAADRYFLPGGTLECYPRIFLSFSRVTARFYGEVCWHCGMRTSEPDWIAHLITVLQCQSSASKGCIDFTVQQRSLSCRRAFTNRCSLMLRAKVTWSLVDRAQSRCVVVWGERNLETMKKANMCSVRDEIWNQGCLDNDKAFDKYTRTKETCAGGLP